MLVIAIYPEKLVLGCPSGHITADKMEIKDSPKFRQVGTSFIRRTLG